MSEYQDKPYFYRGLRCEVLQIDEKWRWPKTYLFIRYTTRRGVTNERWVRNSSVLDAEQSYAKYRTLAP